MLQWVTLSQEILNMGPIFTKISLNKGPFLILSKTFAEYPKLLKNGYILRKILRMGNFVCQNDPKKWVVVLRLKQHTPVQSKSEYPRACTS